MHLTKTEIRYLIKHINQDLDDYNQDKKKLTLEQLTSVHIVKEKLKHELAKEIVKHVATETQKQDNG